MISSLLLYSIKSAMVLTMLYLPYMLLLRRESFFRFNRIVLLGILLLSLVLPLCNIPWMSLDHKPVVQAAQLQMLELGIPVHVLPEVQVVANNMAVNENLRFSVFMLVSVIYIMGMIVLLAMRLWQITRLQYGLKQGALWQDDKQGVCIYCHSGDVAPFSWMRNIVINEKDYDEAGREIILHEMGHIHNRHSWDVVLLTLVQMLQWWNPLVYVLGISLRDVHEYEADDHVLQQGVSAQGYQLLLIRKAVGSGSYAFANSFNHSLTKKRITMMKKSKSNPWMKSKALYVIPVAALALSAFATPKFVAPIEETVTKLEGKGMEKSSNLQAQEEESKDTRKVVELESNPLIHVDGRELMPKEALKAVQGKEIQNNLTTLPDGSKVLSIKTRGTEGGQPLIVLNGKIIEIPKDAKDYDSEERLAKLLDIDAEDIESITVFKGDAAIAKWSSKGSNGVVEINTHRGQRSDESDVKDLVKKLPGAAVDGDGNITLNGKSVSKIMLNDKEVFNNKDSICDVVAESAQFPGGQMECSKWLMEHLRYPELCQELGVQGRVIVGFVVEKDGSISNVKNISSYGMELSEVTVTAYKKEHPDSKPVNAKVVEELFYGEAQRVMKLMPKWEPAKDKDGNVVRCRFTFPVVFRLR